MNKVWFQRLQLMGCLFVIACLMALMEILSR